jgi:uncharacterized membrane protein YoaK (UPF0700 family)
MVAAVFGSRDAQETDPSAGLRRSAVIVALSLTAGSVDVISFLGLGGLFTAHITGNLVILAAHLAGGGAAPLAPMLSVPVFMLALCLTRLLAGGLEIIGRASLRPLLLLQALFLAAFLILCVTQTAPVNPNAAVPVVAGMFGVSAMAVQNALVQVTLKGAPSTAVMTTNVTRFTTDIGTVLLGGDPDEVARARRRAAQTWPSIIGFTVGCALGAASEAKFGLWSLALPTSLALLALMATKRFVLQQEPRPVAEPARLNAASTVGPRQGPCRFLAKAVFSPQRAKSSPRMAR